MRDYIWYSDAVEDCLRMATRLGTTEVVVVFRKSDLAAADRVKELDYGVKVLTGLLVKSRAKIPSTWKAYDLLVGVFSRELMEDKRVSVILGGETMYRTDHTHYRRSGLNQVLCKIMRDSEKTYLFQFSDFLSGDREQWLGRVLQNIRFLKKYSVKMAVGSMTEDAYGVRRVDDMKRLFFL